MPDSMRPDDAARDVMAFLADRDGSDPDATRLYIADLLRDLSRLARRQGDTTLAYLIDMAELEAKSGGSVATRRKAARP
jgi:hypothetical protein